MARQKLRNKEHRHNNSNNNKLRPWSIVGKVVLITGATSGIGKETVLELARRGAKRLILACLIVSDGEKVANEIRRINRRVQVVVRQVDLSSNDSVRRFAAEITATERAIHVLINNAGMLAPSRRAVSVDGNELAFATNYLGHFLLTNLLTGLLKRSAPSRIINVATHAKLVWFYSGRFHLLDDPNFEQPTTRYTWPVAYFQSKLATLLFTRSLHKRLQGSDVTVYSLHPGVVASDIVKDYHYMIRILFPFFAKTPKTGSQTSVYCATEPGIEALSSQHFMDCAPASGPGNYDEEIGERLWQLSEQLTALDKDY